MAIVTTTSAAPSSTEQQQQPGKLFNRKMNLDSFFEEQHRRRLSQRSPYTHEDDLDMTIPPPPPPMHSAIKPSALKDSHSPVCVKDVKHFEPLHYDDCNDSGGVAIDLCIPSIAEQQQAEQQNARLPRKRSSLCSSLSPISEERKVTFAAKHVVLKVDQSDSCAIDQRFVHQVYDAVQLCFIPHYTEYSDEERDAIWYSQRDMAAMKEAAMEAKLSKRREQESLSRAQDFEAELDKCSFLPSPFKDGSSPSPIPVQASSRRARYENTIDAVLLEQYEQRMMCLRVYGRVDHGYSGILDLERLARVYAVVGETKQTHERALAKAMRHLRRTVDEQSNCSDDDDSVGSSSSASSSTDDNNNHNNENNPHPSSRPVLKRTSSFQSTAMHFETTSIIDKSITSVFKVLLSPFLEIRSGDLFLGIGEEMSI